MQQIREIFETRIEEKIEPVIKVGERQDEIKLASEIGSYVVTPTLETYLDDFLEHYTDTLRMPTGEIGVWISGYFGSGKSHLAKIMALLIENRTLAGVAATDRFKARIPSDSHRKAAIERSLFRLSQGDSQVLAFNLNTLSDSRQTPLPRILLSQYYLAKGYGSNLIYARVIEEELDKRGLLNELHETAERLSGRAWADIQRNPTFYAQVLYRAVCEVAPDTFSTPQDVAEALRNAEKGDLYNVQFFVRTVLDDLAQREQRLNKPCRFVLVLDESGQWIEDDEGRLGQLQALVEEADTQGKGKIWIFVTTHEDMGSIYQNARALRGDFKKIESRFRFKFSLTTENIELVLKDRLFRKNLGGRKAVESAYQENPGVLRDLGELKNTSQELPGCNQDRFVTFYPFFPYQIHLIPEIVKRLRSAGGRGEQLSGSTRTLLAITQDIMRAGRRDYLDAVVGELISFDEVYNNLAGEGEVSPDVRRELRRIDEVVPGAIPLTRRIAEVLYLTDEIAYIPRTLDNVARLLVEHTTDDLSSIVSRIQPELERLIKAKMVAKIGEEYEFLTGERRTFEEEVAEEMFELRAQDLEVGLSKFATSDVLGFTTVPFKGKEFPARIFFDDVLAQRDGDVDVRVYSPITAHFQYNPADLEDRSLRPDEQQTIFVLSASIHGFDNNLRYYLAMQRVINRWKGDPHKSDQAHKLASDRELNDLDKLRRRLEADIQDGLRSARVIFRGTSRSVTPRAGQTPSDAVRAELASFWPTIYPRYDKVPVQIINEQRAVLDLLKGVKALSNDVEQLKLFDKAGQIDLNAPVLDAIRIFLSTRQSRNERSLGRDLLTEFSRPPYGWDPNAIRVGVAALVRAGSVRVVIDKKPYSNPADTQLQNALRIGRDFDKVELLLEDTDIDPEILVSVRKQLIALTGNRKIDETPAALATAFEEFATDLQQKAQRAQLYAKPARLPLPAHFVEAQEAFSKILALSNPMHRVKEIHATQDHLRQYTAAIRLVADFVEKRSEAFTDMRDFALQIQGALLWLPQQGMALAFLGNWKMAEVDATVTDKDVWKDLQNAQAAAELEYEQVLAAQRRKAKMELEEVLARLDDDLRANNLPIDSLRETLAQPLHDFIDSLENERDLNVLGYQPRKLTEQIKQSIAVAYQVHASTEGDANGTPAASSASKPTRKIRINDLTPAHPLQEIEHWKLLRERLDQAVQQALAEGANVEIV
jgi:hypothetical protein